MLYKLLPGGDAKIGLGYACLTAALQIGDKRCAGLPFIRDGEARDIPESSSVPVNVKDFFPGMVSTFFILR
jgi:hypothetical protein